MAEVMTDDAPSCPRYLAIASAALAILGATVIVAWPSHHPAGIKLPSLRWPEGAPAVARWPSYCVDGPTDILRCSNRPAADQAPLQSPRPSPGAGPLMALPLSRLVFLPKL